MIEQQNPQNPAPQMPVGSPGVGTDPVSPVLVAGIAEPDLNKALAEVSGGALNSYTEIQDLIRSREQSVELQAKLQGLEQNRFASPLIEKLNELALSGAKADDFETYVRLSKIDLNQLSHAEAIRMQLQFDPAGYTPDQIDAIMEEQYGFAPGTDFNSLSPASQAKLQQARYNALQDLQTRKVSYEPKPVVVDPTEAIRTQQTIAQHANEIATLPAVVPFKAPADPQSGRPEYTFDYVPPADIVANVKAAVVAQIQQNPSAYPATPEGRAAAQNLYNFLLSNATQEDRLNKMVSDIYSDLAAKMQAKNMGKMPVVPDLAAQNNQGQTVKAGPKVLTRADIQQMYGGR